MTFDIVKINQSWHFASICRDHIAL